MNEYELTLVQRARIRIDNSVILQEYFKIYPSYRSRVCSGEVNSALITSCVTWPLFLWRITFRFLLSLRFLSLKVTCAHTRKSHDANYDACMWRGSWTIHLTRRLTFTRRYMEICTNRPNKSVRCLFSRLVGNTKGSPTPCHKWKSRPWMEMSSRVYHTAVLFPEGQTSLGWLSLLLK
jgi:hypothetical protein